MAIQLFGATEAKVKANLPMVQIDSATGTLVTTSNLAILLDQAAAQVNGYIDASCGAGTSATIAADSVSVPYANSTRIVIAAASILVVVAAHHLFAASLEGQAWILHQQAQLDELKADPIRALGLVDDSSTTASVHDRISELELSQTTVAKQGRRLFDGQNPLTGAKEHGFQF